MSKPKPKQNRRPRARHLCQVFAGTVLVGCERAGLDALRAEHRALVKGPSAVGCSVDLDACRQPLEPGAFRWDYVLVCKSEPKLGVGMEVHPGLTSEVDEMIAKKTWADELLGRECPRLSVEMWFWVLPPGSPVSMTRTSPDARRLADAGIGFPAPHIDLR